MNYASDFAGRLALRLLLWVLFGLAGGYIAARKGYSPKIGIIFGVLLGPCGLFVAQYLPRTAEGRLQQEEEDRLDRELHAARVQKTCPQCGCVHSAINAYCPACMYHYPECVSAD
jgi:hypothetical protein